MLKNIFLRTFFIVTSILLLLLFVGFLSRSSCQTPCGCCPDSMSPGLRMQFYIIEVLQKSQLQRMDCSYVGCGPFTRNFFPDLLLGSIFSFSLGLRGFSRRRK